MTPTPRRSEQHRPERAFVYITNSSVFVERRCTVREAFGAKWVEQMNARVLDLVLGKVCRLKIWCRSGSSVLVSRLVFHFEGDCVSCDGNLTDLKVESCLYSGLVCAEDAELWSLQRFARRKPRKSDSRAYSLSLPSVCP